MSNPSGETAIRCLPILPYEVILIELILQAPIPPSVNHYLGHRAVMKGGKPIAVSYCTNEAAKFKKDFTKYVAQEAEAQSWEKPQKTQHIYVDADFYFPRTDMDTNNYWKCMLDAITDTKMVWVDDNIVCERANKILYDPENPRVDLRIHPVDYIGIFEDLAHLEQFESRCIGCSRYERNCSILNNAKNGRVQEEIICGVCQKFRQAAKENKDNGGINNGES